MSSSLFNEGGMFHPLCSLVIVIGVLPSTAEDQSPQVYGSPPRLLIASGIDADGNLVLSGTEQRKKTLPRMVEKDGKKITQDVTMTYPVTVLSRQSVALTDVTIHDCAGHKVSLEQARERLKEPMPILLSLAGDKVDPLYLKAMKPETLTFVFAGLPQFKDLAPAKRTDGIKVGDKVPDFTVQTLDGKGRKLSDLQKDDKRTKNGIVVLSFWCSTCSSCRRVEHDLDRLAKDYEGRAAVVALDANAGETAQRVVAFAKEKGLTLPIVLDPKGRTADLFGNQVTTTTVVIDGNGVLRYFGRFKEGERAYAEEALKAVLAGKDVAVKSTPPDG
jgi:thiol-disulfide isomerase/thioredoxin